MNLRIAPRPAVFFDKDGTLVHDVPHNVDPTLLRLTPGACEAIHCLRDAGFALVVVTNQSGVARGLFPAAALNPIRSELERLLKISFDGFKICPHHPRGTVAPYAVACTCRKPRPGLLLAAARDLGLDLARSWMIGDILDDIEAGSRAGCRTVLVLGGGGETEWSFGPHRTPTLIAHDLAEAARQISSPRTPRHGSFPASGP